MGKLCTITHELNATANDVTYTGGFDAAHRLTSEAISNGLYRWTAGPAGAGTYAPDKLNRYGMVTPPVGPSKLMTHDGAGSVTGYGSWAYVYDAENRLVSASNGTTAVSFTYDPLGRRVGKTQTAPSGSTHAYLHDGDEEVEELGASSLRWVPGAEIDRPLAEILITSANQPRILHTDRRGSVVVVGRLDGVKLEGPYSYDAYGLPSATSGTPVKYTGRRYDPETGLYYYRARYYDAVTGRFWQTDPIWYEGGMNLYAYVGDDPVNKADPTGQFLVPVVAGVAACAANPGCRAAVGGVLGAVTGGTTSAAAQRATTGKIDGRQVVASSIGGAAAGAAAGADPSKAAAYGAIAGAATQVANDALGNNLNSGTPGRATTSAVAEAVGAKAGGAVVGQLSRATGSSATGYVAAETMGAAVGAGAASGTQGAIQAAVNGVVSSAKEQGGIFAQGVRESLRGCKQNGGGCGPP